MNQLLARLFAENERLEREVALLTKQHKRELNAMAAGDRALHAELKRLRELLATAGKVAG